MGLALAVVGCGEEASGTGGSGTMALVTGTVKAADLEEEPAALPGAIVEVMGTSNTATSDVNGDFRVMAPVGVVMFRTTAADSWGSIVADDVPAGGLSNLDIEVIPDELANAVALGFETTADTSKGVTVVTFDDTTTVGGETATITIDSELSFVFDDQEKPSLGNTLLVDGGSEVLFLNTDLANSVTTTATSSTSQPCPREFPGLTYPVQAKMFTEIEVYCPTM